MTVPRTAAELYRQRRGRNVALAVLLVSLVVLFFVVTIIKMKTSMGDRLRPPASVGSVR